MTPATATATASATAFGHRPEAAYRGEAAIALATAAAADPALLGRELAAHRAYLVHFARRRLRDPLQAEDAVHDVFEAVLSGRAVFGGRAALRSWLTAILKHKIVDLVRAGARTDSLDEHDGDDDDAPHAADAHACPQPGPAEIAEQHQWLARVLARIEALPPGLRDAMRLRVLEDRPTAAVCRTLGITEDNLFVRIHRARRQLLS